MPLRVARPDRRWKGSCGRSLVPEPVWCEERQHPVGRCAWGVRLAADTRPGVAVIGSLVCTQPRLLDTVAVRMSLSIDSSPGSWPLALEKSLDFHLLHVLCSVHLRLEHEEQDISPLLPDLQSPHDSARRPRAFCQRFRPRTQRARPFQQPHTHSCSRLFLTVPRHHSA